NHGRDRSLGPPHAAWEESGMRIGNTAQRLALGVLAPLFAASPSWSQGESLDELIAAAKAEGQLVVYSSQAENQTEAILKAFGEQYGITATFLRLTTTPLVQRFATELQSGAPEADVLSISSPTPYDENPDWFLEISEENIPAVAGWPARWVEERHLIW